MKLTNEMVIDAAPDRVFALLTDVRTVAPCLPGARLESSEGDTHRGSVKIKLGPITAAYSGAVRFIEVDAEGRRVVLDARGVLDQHGGNAEAKVSVTVRPHERGSLLALQTDLVVRGKVAQFGRGVLGDVSQKLMEQFAGNISALLDGTPASGTVPAAVQHSDLEASAGLAGLSLVVGPFLKRMAPVLAGFAAGFAVARLAGGRGGRGRRLPGLGEEFVPAMIRIGDRTLDVLVLRVGSAPDR